MLAYSEQTGNQRRKSSKIEFYYVYINNKFYSQSTVLFIQRVKMELKIRYITLYWKAIILRIFKNFLENN